MSWATRRKLLYFAGFMLIVLVLVGIPLFTLFYQKPTCSDGIQNQGEDGVDCGGPCVALCKAAQVDPVIKWQRTFTVSQGDYTAAAYVTNPNLRAEAYNIPYTFTFYNANNDKIGERSGYTNIPAGRNIVVVEPKINTHGDVPVRTIFEFTSAINWKTARKLPELIVSNQTLTNVTGAPTFEADISNPSTVSLGKVVVGAILYDSNGNALGVSKTYLDSLPKKSQQHVVFTWPEPFVSPVTDKEIIPTIQ